MARKTRIKVKLPTINSREEAEAVLLTMQLGVLAKINVSAKIDKEIAAIREKYQDDIAKLDDTLNKSTEILRAWAEANPDEFPKGRKSIEFANGTIGFRTGTPKLALLSRAWNWDKVVNAARHLLGGILIRRKEELDKELALAKYAYKTVDDHELSAIGVKVVQEESFFVDPKITEVEKRQVMEAA